MWHGRLIIDADPLRTKPRQINYNSNWTFQLPDLPCSRHNTFMLTAREVIQTFCPHYFRAFRMDISFRPIKVNFLVVKEPVYRRHMVVKLYDSMA